MKPVSGVFSPTAELKSNSQLGPDVTTPLQLMVARASEWQKDQ